MTKSPQDAQQALDMVAQGRARASEYRHYAESGPILVAWGLTWIVGYLTAQFAPAAANLVWLIGIVGSILFTVVRPSGCGDGRVLATVATAFGFVALLIAMIGGDVRIHNAIIALLVAASYIVIGIWSGVRMVWIGLVVALCAALGWFAFPDWLNLWLGLGGGGALLVSGLWLRRA